MKNGLFNNVHQEAHLQRNGFDLGQNQLFTASAGMLIPFYCVETLPNEHYKINVDGFVRTSPLNAPAYIRLKQNFEFYFVPNRILDRNFPNFVVGTNYIHSLANNGTNNIGHPFDTCFNISARTLSTALGNFGTSSIVDTTDVLGYNCQVGMKRVADMLGYGAIANQFHSVSSSGSQIDNYPNVNIYRALAYQKVYFDWYRNPLLESIENVALWNIDVYPSWDSVYTVDENPFTLRYRNWKRDYINNLRPSFAGSDFMGLSQNGPKNLMSSFVVGDSTSSLLRTVQENSVGSITSNQDAYGGSQAFLKIGYSTRVSSSSENSSQGNSFSITQLRSAYALDKMLRLTQNAKDGDYNSQILAHFGYNPHVDDYKSKFLGSYDSPILINEIESTADTQSGDNGAPVGALYGKGIGSTSNNRDIDFHCSEHGIIIGIYSIVPECDYDSYRLDRHVTHMERNDFYQPEFADLGFQPTYLYEFNTRQVLSSSNVSPVNILGYGVRYGEYKSKLDEIHGEFKRDGTLSAWAASRNVDNANSYLNGITSTFNKINPSVLNTVFLAQFDGTFETDQFYIDLHIKCDAIRPMSVHGIPTV